MISSDTVTLSIDALDQWDDEPADLSDALLAAWD